MRKTISRITSIMLLLCMALTSLPGTAWAAANSETCGEDVTIQYSSSGSASTAISVTVSGTPVVWTDAEPYIDANNRTMVPLRAVGEALGLTVDWDNTARMAIFTSGTKTLYFPIDSKIAHTGDGKSIQMDTTAVIKKNRTYAPVRYLAEYFGFTVNWDGKTNTVSINSPDSAKVDGYKLPVGAGSEYEL